MSLTHYTFAPRFRALYDKAVGLYATGQRGANTFFNDEENAWLLANGITAQHLYDYAEDQNNYGGEPGLENAIAIESIRRDYFLNIQNGKPSTKVLDETHLPAKTDAIKGFTWLPRILPKARAKLRGELPASIMYCCGGDRKFFSTHDIYPAEFLALVWRHENDHDHSAIVEWLERRSTAG